MKTLQLSKGVLTREIIIDQTALKIFAFITFVTLTALGAYVRIPLPFTPVPITLQTFFVLLSAAVLGKRWGLATQAGYLLLGVAGLPVFSGAQSGIVTLFGPTGGYLIGFMVAGWLIGKLVHQHAQPNMWQVTRAMIIGSLAGIYLFGLLGLALFLHTNLIQTLSLGFFPFIPGDIIKIIAASSLYTKMQGRFRLSKKVT